MVQQSYVSSHSSLVSPERSPIWDLVIRVNRNLNYGTVEWGGRVSLDGVAGPGNLGVGAWARWQPLDDLPTKLNREKGPGVCVG